MALNSYPNSGQMWIKRLTKFRSIHILKHVFNAVNDCSLINWHSWSENMFKTITLCENCFDTRNSHSLQNSMPRSINKRIVHQLLEVSLTLIPWVGCNTRPGLGLSSFLCCVDSMLKFKRILAMVTFNSIIANFIPSWKKKRRMILLCLRVNSFIGSIYPYE